MVREKCKAVAKLERGDENGARNGEFLCCRAEKYKRFAEELKFLYEENVNDA